MRGKRVIIFVPGFYGTALADSRTGSRVFQTFGQALWGGIPLALTEPDLGVPDARPLRTDGLLGAVSVIPGIYSLDGYGGSLDFLTDAYGREARVIPFAYDWRRDNYVAVKALAQQVRDLERDGARSIVLVAHSMGGIIVSYYLRYGDADFATATETWEGARHIEAVIAAGVPFGGSIKAFYNLFNGTSVGLATKPLTAVTLGTFPSMYQLVPGSRLLAFDEWKSRRAGLFQDEVSPEIRARRDEYLRWCLSRARALRAIIDGPLVHAPTRKVPFLSVVGIGEDTPSSREKLEEDGDGVVARADAQLPGAYARALAVEKHEIAMPHVGMYVRGDVQEIVKKFLSQ